MVLLNPQSQLAILLAVLAQCRTSGTSDSSSSQPCLLHPAWPHGLRFAKVPGTPPGWLFPREPRLTCHFLWVTWKPPTAATAP